MAFAWNSVATSLGISDFIALWNQRGKILEGALQERQPDLGILPLPRSVDRRGLQDATQAIVDTLGRANDTGNAVWLGEGTLLTGEIEIPGNNLKIMGSGSGYSYGSLNSAKTILKAKPGAGTNLINLVVTGSVVDRTGCVFQDFAIDGNLEIANGFKQSNANIFNRLWAGGCLEAGIRLADFTNGARISQCGLNTNFGWGLKAEGSGTTTYSIDKSNMSNNQLGGADFEAGVVVNVKRSIIESNSGPAVRIYKPDSHTGAMGGFTFEDDWFEDNGTSAPNFTLEIDAETRSEANAPWRITFKSNCRFSPSVATRKYMNIMCAKWVTFEDAQFAGSTAADTFTLGSEARYVAFLECEKGIDGSVSPTDAQFNAAIAAGTRCYRSARDIRYAIGAAGQPAYTNAWTGSAQYWFDREGNVWLGGSITTGTIGLSAFTLPVGYRPAVARRLSVTSNGAFGELLVNTDGTVVPNIGSNVSFSLNGLSFPTG